ncbi:MAG: DUF2442 domain-containing protein [Treponema sp.]|nr:DUF2442 domain-containing protein [Treponema sp.]
MNFSVENVRAQRVWFDKNNLWLALVDGRQLSIPKIYFSRLKDASEESLANYSLSGGGIGIHWDSLDEDLFVPNLLLGINAVTKKSVSA